MDALIIDEFWIKLKSGLPQRSSSTLLESGKSTNFLHIEISLLKRILQILEKQRQCRKKWVVDLTSKLFEHKRLIQFEKLCLNLCSLRWLSPARNLVSSFKPTGLYMLKHEMGTGRPNFSRAFLKDNKLLALGICKSSLFYSEVAYGKNRYLKTSVLQWYVFRPPSFNLVL